MRSLPGAQSVHKQAVCYDAKTVVDFATAAKGDDVQQCALSARVVVGAIGELLGLGRITPAPAARVTLVGIPKAAFTRDQAPGSRNLRKRSGDHRGEAVVRGARHL